MTGASDGGSVSPDFHHRRGTVFSVVEEVVQHAVRFGSDQIMKLGNCQAAAVEENQRSLGEDFRCVCCGDMFAVNTLPVSALEMDGVRHRKVDRANPDANQLSRLWHDAAKRPSDRGLRGVVTSEY